MPVRESHHHQVAADQGGGNGAGNRRGAVRAGHLPHVRPRRHRHFAVEFRRRPSIEAEHSFVLDALDCVGARTFAAVLRAGDRRGSGPGGFRRPRSARRPAWRAAARRQPAHPRWPHRRRASRCPSLRACCNAWRCAWPASKPTSKAMPMAEHDGHAVTLYVQQLLKLRSTGRTRRYEVLLRTDARGCLAAERSAHGRARPRRGSGQRRQARPRGAGRAVLLAGRPTAPSWMWIRPPSR